MAVLNLYLFYFSVKKIKIEEKMKTKGIKMFTKIPMKTSIYMSYLIYHGKANISKIVKIYPNHAPRGIYRHCKQKPTEKVGNKKFKADLKSFWPGMSNL